MLGTATLAANGTATFSFVGGTIDPGTYVCTIQYAGDANHTAANSPSFTFKVNAAPTTTVLTGSTPLFFGDALALTATVNSTSAPGTPRTGTVEFKDGSTVLGSVALDGSSQAVLNISDPTVGTHHYTATYSADLHFKTSKGNKNITIKKDTSSTTIVPAAGNLLPGELTTLTANVALTAGSNTPTGTRDVQGRPQDPGHRRH